MIKIIFAMRDVATANHYAEVIKYLTAAGACDVRVFAQKPAFDVLERNGIAVSEVPASDIDAFTRKRILSLGPDILMVGNSTTTDSTGVDEAVLKLATSPCFIMQDRPGSISIAAKLNHYNHQYLCVTPDAAKTTTAAGFKAHVVGAPSYDAYGAKDYAALKAAFQAGLLQAAKGKIIIGFSGQYLTEHEGYLEIVSELAKALAARDDVHLVYRPHPRERARSMGDVEKTTAVIAEYLGPIGSKWSIDENKGQDCLLAGADITIGYFSTSMLDLVQMNAHSAAPLGVPIAMMWDTATNEKLGVPTYPWLSDGTGYVVTDKRDLATIIKNALKPETKKAVWTASRTLSNGGASAAFNVVQVICNLARDLRYPKPDTLPNKYPWTPPRL